MTKMPLNGSGVVRKAISDIKNGAFCDTCMVFSIVENGMVILVRRSADFEIFLSFQAGS
jgi:hypothetical protein